MKDKKLNVTDDNLTTRPEDDHIRYYDLEYPERLIREIYGQMSKAKRKKEMEDLIRLETEVAYGTRENYDRLLEEGKVKGNRKDYDKFPYGIARSLERYAPDSNGQKFPKVRISEGYVAPGRVETFAQVLVTKSFGLRGGGTRTFKYWAMLCLLDEKPLNGIAAIDSFGEF
ncbi:MAG TPA: hypothetical protein DIW47_06130 [Bacteroidetes bacterium]|nr:hypothetical protein [Bacteroidota bacterium]